MFESRGYPLSGQLEAASAIALKNPDGRRRPVSYLTTDSDPGVTNNRTAQNDGMEEIVKNISGVIAT